MKKKYFQNFHIFCSFYELKRNGDKKQKKSFLKFSDFFFIIEIFWIIFEVSEVTIKL